MIDFHMFLVDKDSSIRNDAFLSRKTLLCYLVWESILAIESNGRAYKKYLRRLRFEPPALFHKVELILPQFQHKPQVY